MNGHISPTYFLDEMTMFEVEAILDAHNHSFQNQWNQARFISYIIALSNGQKIKSPSELISFEWDEKKKKDMKLTEEQIQQMKQDFLQTLENARAGLGQEYKM